MAEHKQVRNVLWCMPRTVSTAVMRAMANRKSSVTFLEPYSRSYFIGEQRVSKRFDEKISPIPGFSFTDIKGYVFEGEHEGKDLVFIKDMAMYVVQAVERGFYKSLDELLPKGYVHTFLIRKPEKAIKSMYSMFASGKVEGWDHWTASEAGYKETYELYEYVKEHFDPNPFVIDADDLLAQPEKVLRRYCEKLGIEFEESMLNWKSTDGVQDSVDIAGPMAAFWEGCLQVDSFTQNTNTPAANAFQAKDLPKEVLDCIEDSQVWYKKLVEHAQKF